MLSLHITEETIIRRIAEVWLTMAFYTHIIQARKEDR